MASDKTINGPAPSAMTYSSEGYHYSVGIHYFVGIDVSKGTPDFQLHVAVLAGDSDEPLTKSLHLQ